ncbi:hypothetical protein RHMOL_Rhmol05G0197700 [Rhododendron molle]|uniref:Uncharacterized protein n=1 Tax=Rhododendron molle TaxID=49168 RepID=A0ACC0NRA2_RHOML|nr:hypothetical protein RHMOL_Rhmol05G0197700 [Rhododendron molle]
MSVDLESLSEATSGAIGALLSTTILYPLDTCKTRYQAEVQAHGQQKYRISCKDYEQLQWVVEKHLEEDRKKRRKRSNLMVVEDSGRPTKKAKGPHDVKGKQFKHGNQFKNKKHFKHGKKKGKKGGCFGCGEIGHYKAACPKRQKSNDGADDGPKDDSKEKVLTVLETMIIEPTIVIGGLTPGNLSDVFREAIRTGQINSLYQGLGTKNLQSFISQFVYFYGYSYFKRLYLVKSGSKSIGTTANLVLAAAAGACTAIVTQPLDTASSKMQTSAFGKSKGLWLTLTEGSWSEAFDGLGISLLLTSNPAIQQHHLFDCFKTSTVNRCKVMIQAADSNDNEASKVTRRSRKTVAWALCAIWKQEGVLGFFKGLHAQILKTVLSSALLLMIKEKITATTWVLILAMQRYLVLTRGRLKSA